LNCHEQYYKPRPVKPEKKKIFYHESTKGRKREKDKIKISCFRDWFYFLKEKAQKFK